MDYEERKCPKCGHAMKVMPDSDWQLYELHSIDYMCPNCLHVERHEYIVLQKERWK